ncbi:hypothetical protein GBA65_10070 [Rubrobacter marinus]|uniref:Uncharacterized protein n=1 Tax=Rubrobacter marinus TaxID=2653852 RepID=A0A6G8PX56_9ACTN|nr:hypothetical protein GBA65_10070 [Rubrobacter marinus]
MREDDVPSTSLPSPLAPILKRRSAVSGVGWFPSPRGPPGRRRRPRPSPRPPRSRAGRSRCRARSPRTPRAPRPSARPSPGPRRPRTAAPAAPRAWPRPDFQTWCPYFLLNSLP